MSSSDPLPPINGIGRVEIAEMVDNSLSGFADHFRMLSFWRRLLAGDNDREEIAQGLVMALGVGRYIRSPETSRGVAITFNISGAVDPKALAETLKEALGGA